MEKKKMPKGKKFTSKNQPSSEAKSKGATKRWQYRKARQQFFEAMCDVKMPDGSKANFWDLVRQQMQADVLSKKSKLSKKEKGDLALKLMKEFMPETSKFEITGADGKELKCPVINIVPVAAKKEDDESKIDT